MSTLWRRTKRNEDGFTLIELAVALAILGILVAIAVPTYLNVRDRAYDAEAKQNLGEIRAVAWSYYIENGSWNRRGATTVITLEDLGYDADHQTDNWSFWIDSNASSSDELHICADGQNLAAGREWLLILDDEGKAQLDGPDVSACDRTP